MDIDDGDDHDIQEQQKICDNEKHDWRLSDRSLGVLHGKAPDAKVKCAIGLCKNKRNPDGLLSVNRCYYFCMECDTPNICDLYVFCW